MLTSSSIGHSVGRSVGPQKVPTLWQPHFSPQQAKIWHGGQCMCVKVSTCVHANLLKEGVAMGVAYCKKVHTVASKWIHRLAQDLVERLVISQRTDD